MHKAPAFLAAAVLTVGFYLLPAAAGTSYAAAPSTPSPAATPSALDGLVTHSAATSLVVQSSDGAEHTYAIAPTAPVAITRNGRKIPLAALQEGDQVTLTLDAHGGVTVVDAAGPTSPAAVSPAPVATATLAPAQPPLDGTLAATSGSGLSVQVADGTWRNFTTATALHVTRNGQDVSLSALQPGDRVTLTLDATGAVTAVAAVAALAPSRQGAGPVEGQVVTVWRDGVAALLPSGVHDFRLGPALRVTRNGTAGPLSLVQSGDAITMTTDAANRITSVAAAGPPAAVKAITPADAAGIAAPPLVLLVLAAAGWWYQRVRRVSRATNTP